MLFRNFMSVTFAVTLIGAALAQIINTTHRSQGFSLHERALENYPDSQTRVMDNKCGIDQMCMDSAGAMASA